MKTKDYDREFLSKIDRAGLRRALWYTRRQDARPHEVNPAAAQYDGLATPASVRAEIERLTARLQTAERRIRSLASAEEPPTPADLEAIADLCRP